MNKSTSTELSPTGAIALSLSAAACVTGAVAGLTVEPEDISASVQQASAQVQSAVQNYLGTNNCKP